MILDASMPTMFWPYAAVHTAFIANRASITESKSPFEPFFSIRPNTTHIHRWGCKIIFHNAHDKNPNTQQRSKMDARGREGILLLIDEKGTHCWMKPDQTMDNWKLAGTQKATQTTNTRWMSRAELQDKKPAMSNPPPAVDTTSNDEVEPEPQVDTTALDEDIQMEDTAKEKPITAEIQTDQGHEDTQTMQTTQRTERPMDIDTPDSIQERVNRQLQDLYTRGILKRSYAHIQQRDDESDDPAAKRIRAMMTKLAEREPRTYTEAVNHHRSVADYISDTELIVVEADGSK
ncbi:Retrovirus-related Pol polyprotein from transposon TNT 1-94 [Ceratocystis lukuohia]|uniref:Retrovirus-related Pol polyprotein from transposon TNT 1-94 n=1 Tax=Ceratocystis lukuohia TaxID=2019550 RepID=A0ABR4MQR3_9PEZI